MNLWSWFLMSALFVLAATNVFLLWEHERIRKRLHFVERQCDTAQNELISLDHQLCRLMIEVEEAAAASGAARRSAT